MDKDRLKGIKWIPFGLLFFGAILKWMHLDEQGFLLNIGFAYFGLVTLTDGFKGKYYKQMNADTLKLLLPVVVILLAVDNLLVGSAHYATLGIAILLHYLIEQRHSLGYKKTVS